MAALDVSIWNGGTDVKYTTAANWTPAGVPADAAILVFNDQAQGPMTDEMIAGDIAAKAHSVIVDRGFRYHIGSVTEPLEPANGFGTIVFAGSGTTSSYFRVDAEKTCTRVFIDSPSSKEDVCVLMADGSYDDIVVRNGKGRLYTGASVTSGGRIRTLGGTGNSSAQFTIDASCTLTGTTLDVAGGRCTTSTTPITASVRNSGELILADTAGVSTLLEMLGGICYWDAASSTLAKVEAFGGQLITRSDRQSRVITNMDTYGAAIVDFSIGGYTINFSNAPRVLGDNPIKMPPGLTVTYAA